MTHRTHHRAAGVLALAAALALPAAAHASREEAARAALQLAESIHPGKLELLSTHLRKGGYYEIVLGLRGDAVTRIRFDMDRDPADCRLGTRCEERFRRSYDNGVALGQELQALDAALRGCGLPALAVIRPGGSGGVVPVVSAKLDDSTEPAVRKTLTGCMQDFRDAGHDAPWWRDRQVMRAIVLGNRDVPPQAAPAPLHWDSQVPDALLLDTAYGVRVALDTPAVSLGGWQLQSMSPLRDKIKDTVVKAAQGYLRDQPDGLVLESSPVLRETTLAPPGLDRVHTYVMACTPAARQGRRCARPDVLLRVAYDLDRHAVTDIQRQALERDHLGSPQLPPLPQHPD